MALSAGEANPWLHVSTFRGAITLNAWLAARISAALQTLGRQKQPREQKRRLSAYRQQAEALSGRKPRRASHHFSSELWRVVVHVGDLDDGGGGVGEAVHGVALHVSGLDDQRVLRHLLDTSGEKKGRD